MKKSPIEAIIFDMDGCLYPFDRGSGKVFGESMFGQSIKQKEIEFTAHQLNVSVGAATEINRDLKDRYDSHLSIGLEREFGLPREEFFDFTWNLEPPEFLDKQEGLGGALGGLTVRSALLSAAPRVWVDKALDHLDVSTMFGDAIFSGDADIRKPSLAAFEQVTDFLGCDPEHVTSIGDQDHTDILPAKKLGMTTVRIGTNIETEADFLATDVTEALTLLRESGFKI